MKRLVVFILIIPLLLLSCTSVPVTGRKQLSLIPNSQILPMSFDQYEQVLKEGKVMNSGEWSDMVKRVGKKTQFAVEQYMASIDASSELDGFNWEFNLIEEDIVNAWCMPGGKVAFYTGIMPICKNEEGVAVVMGHEIAHAIANHGRERMSQGLITQFGMSSLSAAMGSNPSATSNIFMQ